MLKKIGTNGFWLMWCMVLLSAFGIFSNRSVFAQSGIDSYTKLMLHADGSDQGTSFTDSSTTPKTVTNTESYDSYTKLMLHMENNVTDSAVGKTVTNNNTTFSSSVYKMGGNSGVFNGSNAYLSLADSDDWNFGSGDFTIDFWVRFNSLPPVNYAAAFYSQRTDGNNESWFGLRNDGNLYFKQTSGGANVVEIIRTPSPAITTGQWYHITLIRNGSIFRIYVDGVQVGSDYTSSSTLLNYSGSLAIGVAYSDSPTHFLDGYLDELRISKGIARWTSDFTSPSSPYGKVHTVTGTKKFGTASGEFKGSGGYLYVGDSSDVSFASTEVWTVDFWIRPGAFTSQDMIWSSIDGGGEYIAPHFYNYGGWKFDFLIYGFDHYSTTIFSENSWYHIAMTCDGSGNHDLFVNGTLETEFSQTYDVSGSVIFRIGWHPGNNYFTGHIDEFRISKGVRRWTSNFTPPSAPYGEDTTSPTVSSTSPDAATAEGECAGGDGR